MLVTVYSSTACQCINPGISMSSFQIKQFLRSRSCDGMKVRGYRTVYVNTLVITLQGLVIERWSWTWPRLSSNMHRSTVGKPLKREIRAIHSRLIRTLLSFYSTRQRGALVHQELWCSVSWPSVSKQGGVRLPRRHMTELERTYGSSSDILVKSQSYERLQTGWWPFWIIWEGSVWRTH